MLPPPSFPPSWRTLSVAAIVATLLFVGLTWPLYLHPSTTVLSTPSLYGPAAWLIQRDINLTMWVLAWDTHALTTNPSTLFHANAFHPAPYSLAFSEHMLGNLPFFAPIFLATGNPVLAHQVTLAATFAVAAATMAAYVEYWTRDAVAAVVAGVLFALAPARLWQLGSLHVISVHLLPAVLLCIDRILDGRRGRPAGGVLFLALAVSSLCSYYVGYQAFVTAGLYTLVGLGTRRTFDLPRLTRLAVPTIAAAAVVGLVTVPYVLLQHSGALPDYENRGYASLAFFAIFKFGVLGLLEFFVRPLPGGIPQYLTATAMTLGVVGAWRGHVTPRSGLIAVGVVGAVLSLGPVYPIAGRAEPYMLPYDWLARIIPGFSAMRAPQRFGILATVAVTGLAGLGLASLRTWLAARGRPWLAALLPLSMLCTLAAETYPGRLAGQGMPLAGGLPPAIQWLAKHGDGAPVLHLPLDRVSQYRESLAMYYSIFTWLPVANGYSSYPPRSYVDLVAAAERLPDPAALPDVLTRSHARWIVFDRRQIPPDELDAWRRTLSEAMPVAFEFGDLTVYEARRT